MAVFREMDAEVLSRLPAHVFRSLKGAVTIGQIMTDNDLYWYTVL